MILFRARVSERERERVSSGSDSLSRVDGTCRVPREKAPQHENERYNILFDNGVVALLGMFFTCKRI